MLTNAGFGTVLILGLLVALAILFFSGMKIVRPTRRGLIERLGRYKRFAKPGFNWIVPGIDKLYLVNVTEQMVNADRQEIITSDNLNAIVDAQIYFKVKADEEDTKNSQYNVNDVRVQIVSLARTTLRNIIGTMTLKQANSERNKINSALQETLEKETGKWGIEIVRTELKEIDPPKDVQETMNKIVKAANEKLAAVDFATAAETTADGVKRAKIKEAEGIKESLILKATGEAGAIKLVNQAAEEFFVGNAQLLKQLETVAVALQNNAKIVIPDGKSLINVIGDLAGGGPRTSTK
jgi:regulator of protease activity HflC (stomatin/prohibitin superfamily)